MGFPHLPTTLVLIGKAAASSPSGSLTAISQVPQPTMTPMDIEQVMKCEFDTIKSLVDHVLGDNRTSYNVSFLIQTCPDVCGLVYGSGNPDISGVGAVASYIIQGISSLIFGPMLAFITLYLSSSKSHDSYFTYDPENLGVAKHFFPVSKSIHQANIMTAFAVVVAGVYRIIFNSDLLTVGENEFLTTLSTYQLYLLTCIVCTISYLPLHPSSILERTVLAIYMLGTIVLWVSIQSSWSDSYRSVVAMKGIALHCIQQTEHAGWPTAVLNDILILPPVLIGSDPHIRHGGPESAYSTWSLLMLIIVIIVLLVSGPVLPMVVLGVSLLFFLLRLVLYRPFLKLAEVLRVGPHRLETLTGAFILVWFFSVFVKSLLDSLFETREQLRSLAGEKYEDNDWGFGQITAVMTWVPVLQETGFAVIRTIRHYTRVRASRRRHGTAQQSSEWLELLLSGQNSDNAENEGPGGTATPSVSPEDSDSDSEPITTSTSTDMPSRTSGTTSSQARPDGATLQPRGTWPRNESDTYLPLRA